MGALLEVEYSRLGESSETGWANMLFLDGVYVECPDGLVRFSWTKNHDHASTDAIWLVKSHRPAIHYA